MLKEPGLYANEPWLKYVVFTVLLSLHFCQTKLQMNHNDLHCENVLVDALRPRPSFAVTIEKQHFVLPAMQRGCILWDFEFSDVFDGKVNTQNIRNRFGKDEEDNIPVTFNPYYDAHVFLMRLAAMALCPAPMKAWIYSQYPKEARSLVDLDDEEDEHDDESEREEDEHDDESEREDEELSSIRIIQKHHQIITEALDQLGKEDVSRHLTKLLAEFVETGDDDDIDDEEDRETCSDKDEDDTMSYVTDDSNSERDIFVSFDDEGTFTNESFYDKDNADYDAYHNSHLKKEYLAERKRDATTEPPLSNERNRYIDGFRLINKHQAELKLPSIRHLLLDDYFASYRATTIGPKIPVLKFR